MSEKKVLKMNDEAMKNVTGGQENSSGYDASFDINTNYEESWNTVRITCPECGGDLGFIPKGNNWNGVCPHCKKTFSITV